MDGTTISAKRTGAVSGVAIKYLAKENAEVLTIIGAGVQGRTQLEAALIARPSIKDIYINDLFFEKAKEFASQMGEKLNRTIIPVENAAECSKKSDIIITVTLSTTPIVEADWLKPGALYLNLADNECTYEAVRKCDKIVVDTWENIKHRKVSTISLMYDDGLLEDSEIYAEIGEIINGKKPGRENDTEIIYFNAVGMGIEDIGIAAGIYRKAVEQNIGTEVIWWEDCK
jgi:ornithine cyclodeaminase